MNKLNNAVNRIFYQKLYWFHYPWKHGLHPQEPVKKIVFVVDRVRLSNQMELVQLDQGVDLFPL